MNLSFRGAKRVPLAMALFVAVASTASVGPLQNSALAVTKTTKKSSTKATATGKLPAQPFTLTTSESNVSVEAGSDVIISLIATRVKGFTEPIYLGVRSLPQGVRVTTAQNPLKGNDTTVKISVDDTFAPKSFSAILTGSSKGKSSQQTVKVTVVKPSPSTTPVTSPSTTSSPTTIASTIPATIASTIPATTSTSKAPAATVTTSVLSDFSLTADQNLSLPASGTAVATITVVRTGGFKDPLDFSVSGLPDKVSGAFSPGPNADTTLLTLKASGAQVGGASFTVTSRSRSVKVNLNIVASSPIVATPTNVSLAAAGSVGVKIRWGKDLPIGAAVNWAVTGLPTAVSGAFMPNGVAANESTLVLTAESTAPVGSSTMVTVTASSGSASTSFLSDVVTIPLTITAIGSGPATSTPVATVVATPVTTPGQVTIPLGGGSTATSAVVTPSLLTIAPGSSANVLFTPGTGVDVSKPGLSFSQVGLPAGVSPSANISGTSLSLLLSVAQGTPAGTYSVSFTVGQGTVLSSGVLSLTISQTAVAVTSTTTTAPVSTASFVVVSGQTAVSIARGNTGTVSVSSNFSTTAAEPVTYSILGLPIGASVALSTSNPVLGPTTVSISVPATASTGTYQLTITGSITGKGSNTLSMPLVVS